MKTKGIDYEQERKLVCEQLLKSTRISFEHELASILEQLTDKRSNRIQPDYGFVPPFMGGNDIKLIVIGQDPTIRNEERRKNIICTLNLDKQGALRKYVKQICDNMEITIENVYATNVFKYFYGRPPADTLDVLKEHLQSNLELLKKELSCFPNVPIITLGEPVLKLLTGNEQAKVRYYWRYDSKKGTRNGEFLRVEAKESKFRRPFYPFCHQPSIRKQFYSNNLEDYCHFVIGKPRN